MKKDNFACFGELIWDKFNSELYLGGAPTNVARHFGLQGLNSYLFSSVGDDNLSMMAIKRLKEDNVDTKFILKYSNRNSGIAVFDEKKDKYHLINDFTFDYDLNRLETLSPSNFKVFYYNSLPSYSNEIYNSFTQLISQSKIEYLAYDLNIRSSNLNIFLIEELLVKADIVKASITEVRLIGEFLFDRHDDYTSKLISEYNIGILIITDSSNNIDCYFNKKNFQVKPTVKPSANQVGAGDALFATFLNYYSQTKNIELSLMKGLIITEVTLNNKEAVPKYDKQILLGS